MAESDSHLAFGRKIPKNKAMSKLLLILALFPLVWAQESAQTLEGTSVLNDSKDLLIICDLQGALFFPKSASQKVATIQNIEVAQLLKKHTEQGAKLLYVAEHQAEIMFWQNSIKANKLPLEANFNLSNEVFHGFESSLPSCRLGVVLCQGQPLGETLGIVINQLWIWTQFNPKKILFYTSNKQRGEIATEIGNRIGATVDVKLVKGIVGTSPITTITKPKPAKAKRAQKLRRKTVSPQQNVKHPPAKQEKVLVTPDTGIKKDPPPIKFDESKLKRI